MNLKKITVGLASILTFSAISLSAHANNVTYVNPSLNKNGDPEFKQLKPARATNNSQKIEVVELFYYGCPHCFELESHLLDWKKTIAKDVEFKRVPAVFRPEWESYAKLYYTLEAMNLVDKHHADVFEAVQMENVNLGDEAILNAWLKKQSIDSKKFMDIYKSFSIRSKVEYAKKMTKSYEIKGVPSLIINGKYMTSGSMTLDFKRLFSVTNMLISKERDANKK